MAERPAGGLHTLGSIGADLPAVANTSTAHSDIYDPLLTLLRSEGSLTGTLEGEGVGVFDGALGVARCTALREEIDMLHHTGGAPVFSVCGYACKVLRLAFTARVCLRGKVASDFCLRVFRRKTAGQPKQAVRNKQRGFKQGGSSHHQQAWRARADFGHDERQRRRAARN